MIFDTTEIDNQITALQQERDRQNALNDAAIKCLSGLADLIDQLDQDAIAILKAEVLALFGELESLAVKDFEALSDTPEGELESLADTSDGEPETLAVEDFEAIFVTPDGEPEETISDRVRELKDDYYQLIPTKNPALAYFKRQDGELGCAYLGGMSQSRLAAWGDWLYQNGYTTHPPILRESKRLGNWRYEVKLPPLPMTYLNDLIDLDYTRYPSPSSQVLAA